jgi:GT2 family glycosyltransferase
MTQSEITAEVVIVTHDAPVEQVLRAVDSVLTHTPGARIFLVHNGADPAPLRESCATRSAVRLISTINRGYAAAVNLGISATTTDKVVVLNDDVEVTPQWWPPLAAALDEDAGLGAVAPLLLLAGRGDDAEPLINSAGVTLGSDGAGMDIGYGQLFTTAPVDPTEIRIFSGGAVMLRRQMWQELGGLDTRYFLYYEDVDLSLRGAEAGWRYLLIPTSRVIHAQGSTTNEPQHAPLVVFLRERNRLWITWRFGSIQQVRGALWLSLRRLRHPPHRIHARALWAGLSAAPALLRARLIARRLRTAH